MVKYTNNHNISKEIVNAIVNDDYDYPTDERTIPCSKLISPPRIAILSKRHDKEIIKDVSDDIWMLLGTAIHYIIAQQNSDGCLVEQRLKQELNGYTITGKPDYFDVATGHLNDFKITSVYKVIFGQKEGYKEWTEQLNVYAWLLRKSGYKVAFCSITAILRDWQAREAKRNDDYPPIQVHTIDIPLWSEEKQLKFISDRLEALIQNDNCPDELLELCTSEERWASADTYAVMKEGRKSAVRVLESANEAEAYIVTNKLKSCRVVKRPGEDRRCEQYCNVNQWCNYYKSKGDQE